MDEIRIRKRTVIILLIALGLLLMVVCAVRPRTLYEMREAAIDEFHIVMAEDNVDLDLLAGPTLNLTYPGLIDFEWRSKDYATDSVVVHVAVKSSWFGGESVWGPGGLGGDMYRTKFVESLLRKKANSR